MNNEVFIIEVKENQARWAHQLKSSLHESGGFFWNVNSKVTDQKKDGRSHLL
jgi:GR25 family glycosyltransferase involved in LPS biosynthesis